MKKLTYRRPNINGESRNDVAAAKNAGTRWMLEGESSIMYICPNAVFGFTSLTKMNSWVAH